MRSLSVGCALLVAAAAPVQAQTGAPVSAPCPPGVEQLALQGLGALINDSLKKWQVSGVGVSIVRDGKVLLSQGYGVRDPRTGAPVTKDTIFPLASLAKAFTGVGVGILVDEGKMRFGGAARSYIPFFELSDPIATQEVTIRDLLSHRSGLAGKNDYVYYRNRQITPEEVINRMAHFELRARPRQSYHYSNAAYVAVGQAMEHAAGVPYERLMQDRIFEPLGMNRTTFSASEAKADANHTVGRWLWQGKPVFEFFDGGRIINPHGGINSTAEDMAKWMILNLSEGKFEGNQVIEPATLREVQTTQVPVANVRPEMIPLGYAMGWGTQIYRGEPMLAHEGGVPGIRTSTYLLPRRGIGVTVLANENGSLLPYLLSLEILDRLLCAAPANWLNGPDLAAKIARDAAQTKSDGENSRPSAGAPRTHEMANYAGTYENPAYGRFQVRLTDGGLVAEYNHHSAPLVHRHGAVFATDPQSPFTVVEGRVLFIDDYDGRVAKLTWEPFGSSQFEKQPDEKLSDPRYLLNLAGTYLLDNSKINIRVVGEQLVYQRDDQAPATLVPAIDGNFHHPRAPGLHFSFRFDSSGRAIAMIRTENGISVELPRSGG